ncbi:uncharacterized protein LOC125072742 [Vanessa atalanta]|uniref:uncharacterized protein LOC125072742 n=1 Tax=Vanessa atalanta TaxID=42275 RepID=UPI001FCCE857|nr:uncharacterized protein LOC125072742 [Vanessa atalanta]
MLCRVLTFCVLVTIVLFVVLSCLYRRPVYHLFFHRCCGEDIENDQVIFENFGNNFLRERLIGAEIVEVDNSTLYGPDDDFADIEDVKLITNVHDPESRDIAMGKKFKISDKEIMVIQDTAYRDVEVLITTEDTVI